MQLSVIITTANVESVSLFLLNCDEALFKANLSKDSIRHLRGILNEKYRGYVRFMLFNIDMEREVKVKQMTVAIENMIASANQLAAFLTVDGLQQLHAILNRNNRAAKKTVCHDYAME